MAPAAAASSSAAPLGATASADEIARFQAIADAWWDAAGKFRPLHQLNAPRLQFLRDTLAKHFGRDPLSPRPFEGLRLLDVGCGGGLVAEPMARLGFAVTGVDAGEKNIAVAKLHAERMGLSIDYRACTPEVLDESYDVVLAMEVIEHVADVPLFLSALSARLRPGGAFVGATLNRTPQSWALAIAGAEYILRWLPRGTHSWKKFVKPSEFSAGLRRVGIDTETLTGIHFNPFRDCWDLAPGLNVNYLIKGTKPL